MAIKAAITAIIISVVNSVHAQIMDANKAHIAVEWIRNTIISNTFNSGEVHHTYDFELHIMHGAEEGDCTAYLTIIHEQKSKDRIGDFYYRHFICVKDIVAVHFIKFPSTTKLVFEIRKNPDNLTRIGYKSGNLIDDLKISLILNHSIRQDNYPTRIRRAVNDLVTMFGGRGIVIDDAY